MNTSGSFPHLCPLPSGEDLCHLQEQEAITFRNKCYSSDPSHSCYMAKKIRSPHCLPRSNLWYSLSLLFLLQALSLLWIASSRRKTFSIKKKKQDRRHFQSGYLSQAKEMLALIIQPFPLTGYVHTWPLGSPGDGVVSGDTLSLHFREVCREDPTVTATA